MLNRTAEISLSRNVKSYSWTFQLFLLFQVLKSTDLGTWIFLSAWRFLYSPLLLLLLYFMISKKIKEENKILQRLGSHEKLLMFVYQMHARLHSDVYSMLLSPYPSLENSVPTIHIQKKITLILGYQIKLKDTLQI